MGVGSLFACEADTGSVFPHAELLKYKFIVNSTLIYLLDHESGDERYLVDSQRVFSSFALTV